MTTREGDVKRYKKFAKTVGDNVKQRKKMEKEQQEMQKKQREAKMQQEVEKSKQEFIENRRKKAIESLNQ